MSPNYNQNYTKNEIDSILSKIKYCIKKGKYIISLNCKRNENIKFINEYNIRGSKRESILMRIRTEDFCYSLRNTNVGYEDEVLYVFVPQMQLFNSEGIEEMVDIYIKFNLIDIQHKTKTIIISFHKKNKPVDYLFR